MQNGMRGKGSAEAQVAYTGPCTQGKGGSGRASCAIVRNVIVVNVTPRWPSAHTSSAHANVASTEAPWNGLALLISTEFCLHASSSWRKRQLPMRSLQRVCNWLDGHQSAALDAVRTYLGVGLLVRGALFITDPAASIEQVSGPDVSTFWSGMVVHYVAVAHLVGGALMAIGLLTRIAALVQVPVLVGAVFLVHSQNALLSANQSLEFSALVLFLLLVIFAFGSGQWSADAYIFGRATSRQPEAGQASRAALPATDEDAAGQKGGIAPSPAPAPVRLVTCCPARRGGFGSSGLSTCGTRSRLDDEGGDVRLRQRPQPPAGDGGAALQHVGPAVLFTGHIGPGERSGVLVRDVWDGDEAHPRPRRAPQVPISRIAQEWGPDCLCLL